MTLIGYHGTNNIAYNGIRAKGFKTSSNGWFGKEAYFFYLDEDMAKKWAVKNFSGKNPIVIKAEITFEKDELFDIRCPNSSDTKFFHNFRRDYKEILKNKGVGYTTKDAHDNDCNLLTLICKLYNKKVVMGNSFSFVDNGPASIVPNGTELCVTDNKIIKITEKKSI